MVSSSETVSTNATMRRGFLRGQEHTTACQGHEAALRDGIAAGFGLKQSRYRGLHYLPHRVARKRIQHEKARRQFVGRQQLLGPGAEGRQIESIAVIHRVV